MTVTETEALIQELAHKFMPEGCKIRADATLNSVGFYCTFPDGLRRGAIGPNVFEDEADIHGWVVASCKRLRDWHDKKKKETQ